MAEKKQVGTVRHFFTKISVAVVDLTGDLAVGDPISIEGKTGTNLQQRVASMQIEGQNIQAAKKGQSIGMKMNDRVKDGDIVYKLTGL